MSWLLYLPTRELADALQSINPTPTNAVVAVSGNWDTPSIIDESPLQPVEIPGLNAPVLLTDMRA